MPGLVVVAVPNIPTVDLRSPSRSITQGIAVPRALLSAPAAPLRVASPTLSLRAPPPVQRQSDPAETTDDMEVSESPADDETE